MKMNVEDWFAGMTAACEEVNRQVRTGEITKLSKALGDQKVINAVEQRLSHHTPEEIWVKK